MTLFLVFLFLSRYDLCYWFFATVEMFGQKVVDLVTWALETMLGLASSAIKAATGGTVSVRFALDSKQAYPICKATKYVERQDDTYSSSSLYLYTLVPRLS